ncbi:hypothetical protein MNBD_GAMMA24-2813 [hydrothermal vent metagenome]|uniref:Uncharacterized protein n=1 Tax=hydrothermal vent metagenome TaxID=652676 RepID=A0A3B1BAB7_9ZZZZ
MFLFRRQARKAGVVAGIPLPCVMKFFSRGTSGSVFLLALTLIAVLPVNAEVQTFTDENSGLQSWKAQHPGFSLQFIQLLPDYVRAVYSARGLPKKAVELMASYCIFGTIIQNKSAYPLSYQVADWRYVTLDGQSHPVKTKTQWLKEWRSMGVTFRFSLLPDEQTFSPGDWSQGFTTLAVPPDTPVALHYFWTLQGKKHEGVIKNLRCAPAKAPHS